MEEHWPPEPKMLVQFQPGALDKKSKKIKLKLEGMRAKVP